MRKASRIWVLLAWGVLALASGVTVVGAEDVAASIRGASAVDWSRSAVVPTCANLAFDYNQPFDPDNFDFAYTSDLDVGLRVAEGIVDLGLIDPRPAGSVLTEVIFYGISLEWDDVVGAFQGYCPADDSGGTAFEITLYQDDGGQPGAEVARRQCAVPTAVTDTGFGNYNGATIREYRVPIPGSFLAAGDAAWVQIARRVGANAANGNPCLFLWVDEELAGSYDDQAFQYDVLDPGSNIMSPPNDLAICLQYLVGVGDPADEYGGFECGVEEFDSAVGLP